jgi:hypothetical protein
MRKNHPGNIEERGGTYRVRLSVAGQRHRFKLDEGTTRGERLAHVFATVGAKNLRDFWRRLSEGADPHYSVSYEAVRNYHAGREAPIGYLEQVSKAFGISLLWIAVGEGPAMRAEEQQKQMKQRINEALQVAFATNAGVSPAARFAFNSFKNNLPADPGISMMTRDLPSDEHLALALSAPFRAFSEAFGHELLPLNHVELEDYILRAGPAIADALQESLRNSLVRIERRESEDDPNSEEVADV